MNKKINILNENNNVLLYTVSHLSLVSLGPRYCYGYMHEILVTAAPLLRHNKNLKI